MIHPIVRGQSLRLIAFALVLSTPVLAQTPSTPDLSGTWLLRVPKSDKAPKSSAAGPEILRITCTGPNIDMISESHGKQVTARYVADGQEHEIGFWQESDRRFVKTAWAGSELVTVITYSNPDARATIHTTTARWNLSADGHTLTQTVDELKSWIRVYDKRP